MVSRIIYGVVAVIEGLVALRFIFRLLGANPDAAFVEWIYSWSTPFVTPFAGIFGQNAEVVVGPDVVVQSMFDWTALVALIVYAIIAAIVGRALAGR